MNDCEKMMNPLSRVQREIANIIRADPWIQSHRVEVIEQNAQELAFLLQKSIAQLNGVAIVVGTDDIENNPPVFNTTTTITATENVVMNRTGENYATALDAMQVVIRAVDGADWCFDNLKHEAPTQGVLQATATFRGQVLRDTTTDSNP